MRPSWIAAAFAACVAVGCADDTEGDAPGTTSGAPADGSSGIGGSGTTEITSTGSTGAAVDTGSASSDGGSGSSGGMATVCDVVGVVGECGDVSSCPSDFTAFQGLCGGDPSHQCCVPTSPPCSRLGAPGLCMPESLCPAPFEQSDGFCPDTELYQCCTDPLTQCGAEQMPLPNEGLAEEEWDEQCPPGMVLVSSNPAPVEPYCIDRYEASLELLDDDGELVSTWSPYHYPGAARVRAVSVRGAIPQGYISQLLADKACVEAGKRLCSGGEWSVGCSGPDFFIFPYGDGWMPEACNEQRFIPPQVEYFGTSEAWVNDELGHPCLSQLPDTLDVTGQNEACEGTWGTIDMMGNLLEWTSDVSGTLRGGSYIDAMNEGPGCYYESVGVGPQYWDFRTGFRCCADPLE